MEDFAHILQRNYGLKPAGKAAPMASGGGRAGATLDKGQSGSGGSGAGRNNRAAVLAAGDEFEVYSRRSNGIVKPTGRHVDPAVAFGSSPDDVFRGPAKSSSAGGLDDVFGGPNSGSSSSSSFGELLGGSLGKQAVRSRPRASQSSSNAFSQTKSRPVDRAAPSAEEQGRRDPAGRKSSRSANSQRSVEDEFLGSIAGEPKSSGQTGTSPSSCNGDLPGSQMGSENQNPLEGSFMRGFGQPRAGRSSTHFKSPAMSPTHLRRGDAAFELPSRQGVSAPIRSKLKVDSNQNTTASAASSLSMDDPFSSLGEAEAETEAEVDSFGGEDSTAGFTIPASDASAVPDLNEPYTAPRVSTRRRSHPKISGSDVDTGEALAEALNGLPKPPPIATAKVKDTSSPGTSAPGSGCWLSSRGLNNEEGRGFRKSYPNSPFVPDSLDSPSASPSYISRPRRHKFTEMYSNGSSPGVDEPVTAFEVNIPAGGDGPHHYEETYAAQKAADLQGEVWLTINDIRLVTQPSASPPPSRAPPRPGLLERKYSGMERQHSGLGKPPPGLERQHSDLEKPQPGLERQHSGREKPQPGLERQHSGLETPGLGTEGQQRGEEAAAPPVEGQQAAGIVMPEVTIVDLGPQLKPSREERRRLREHLERERRRANREEERPKEREGLRESLYRDAEVRRDRDTPRSREGRREKVMPMPMPEPQDQEAVIQKEQKELQNRVLRQQEKDFQERMVRQEEARERENERVAQKVRRSAEKAAQEARERENERVAQKVRRSAEKAAQEARERAEKAAVERAVNEARERAERAALQRAAAAKEQERIKERERREKEKERERERERERDREQEKLRDRMREKEKGVAEQLRRDAFRATSEPRQRPSVSTHAPSGLSRHASGININNLSAAGTPGAQPRGSTAQKVVDDWTNLFTQPSPSPSTADEFREIPGEPADRRKLRLEKQMRIEERAAKALQEKNQRDQALQQEQEERHRFASNLDAEVRRWSVGKEGNLRALLSSLHLMLWPECNWKVVSLSDLITGPSVKKAYQKAILCVHPDKVQQKGANVQQKYIAEKVFDLLKDAYARFNANELY